MGAGEPGCPVRLEAGHDPPYFVMERFDDVATALRDPERWRNADGPGVFYQEAGVLGTTDDPDHARHRRILRGAFLPSAMARLEPAVAEISRWLLDDMVPRGRGDFVELFAKPFPGMVIGELLGVRPADRGDFRAWADALAATLSSGDVDEYEKAKRAMGDYVDDVLAEREATLARGGELPGDALTTMLLARREGSLTAAEVRHLGHQLLVAGHETTASLLATLLLRFVTEPALMAAVRADPILLNAAIEEGVRLEAPVRGLFRTNAEPCSFAGLDLPARSKVQLLFAAANRDPDHWDAPAEFRLDRPELSTRGHLGFGWGIHYCLGAPLARLESAIAFEQIFAAMDGIELDGEPVRHETIVLQGLARLPLRWRARDRQRAR